MLKLKGAEKGRQTQWATQFLAAAELIRRGYNVSFTQGNKHTCSRSYGRLA